MEQTSFDLLSSDSDRPKGFQYWPSFLEVAEELELLQTLRTLDWQLVKMHGAVARRRVAHFGLDYEYESWQLSEGPEIPISFEPLVLRACKVLSVERKEIAALLATHYPPGAGIGWHRDAPMFGASVFGVSLGGACTMKFRRKNAENEFDVIKAELASRSAYVIGGVARSEWQHAIPSVKFDRYSITIRMRNLNFKPRSRLNYG